MLRGQIVTLRPIRFDDWEKTINWRNDMHIKNSTMSHPFPITNEQEQQWYKKKLEGFDNSFIPFSIIDNENEVMVGYMNLFSTDWVHRHCFIGGAIGLKENFGKGYGKEAVSLLLNYAFKNLNLNKVYAYVLEDHPAMKAWLELGASNEGLLKEHHYNQGKYKNVCVLAWYSQKTTGED